MSICSNCNKPAEQIVQIKTFELSGGKKGEVQGKEKRGFNFPCCNNPECITRMVEVLARINLRLK